MFDPATGRAQLDPMPAPEPAHQRRILREKWFEVVSVILLIVGGTAYLAWRNAHAHAPSTAVESVQEAAALVGARGYEALATETVMDRQYSGFRKGLRDFDGHVELYGVGADTPLETAVLWLSPGAGSGSPSEIAMQAAVNDMANLASVLVPASGEALQKAIKTSELVTREQGRAYDRGVVGTNDGWKVTYITYRSFDEGAVAQPVLYLILQRLTAGAAPELAEFNRRLYRAVEEGIEVKSHLKAG